MNKRPILFSAPMIRAILDGRKVQTRRLIKPQPESDRWLLDLFESGEWERRPQPYRVGYRLWVKEAIRRVPGSERSVYIADDTPTVADAWPWKNSALPGMYCPRGLSRIALEVTGVRVERLQEISGDDALAEGIRGLPVAVNGEESPRKAFARLWDHINGKRAPWTSNPWVWVVSFRRVHGERQSAIDEAAT